MAVTLAVCLFVGCVMYADDLLLVSASIHKLQLMIDICCSEADKLDMKFNAIKSQAIRIWKVASYGYRSHNIKWLGHMFC